MEIAACDLLLSIWSFTVINKINKIDLFFIQQLKKFQYPVFQYVSKIGGVISIALFLIFLFFISFQSKKEVFFTLLLALTLTTILVFILKYTIRRKRMNYHDNPFLLHFDPYSFPSGHISRLMAFVIPFWFFPIIFSLFIVLSFLSAFARMVCGYHYFSDCLAGGCIGLLSGLFAKFIWIYCNDLFLIIIAQLPIISNW
ncbi:MAG: phosphatase PAP2 family protein [Spirochaetes bacterium]|nr:phosphatase PAP2 family protein [Spirochaetota bacterium]